MTVAEALSCKTPVVTTDGTPWTELPAHHAGWCVPVGAETLIPALREALDTPRKNSQPWRGRTPLDGTGFQLERDRPENRGRISLAG